MFVFPWTYNMHLQNFIAPSQIFGMKSQPFENVSRIRVETLCRYLKRISNHNMFNLDGFIWNFSLVNNPHILYKDFIFYIIWRNIVLTRFDSTENHKRQLINYLIIEIIFNIYVPMVVIISSKIKPDCQKWNLVVHRG